MIARGTGWVVAGLVGAAVVSMAACSSDTARATATPDAAVCTHVIDSLVVAGDDLFTVVAGTTQVSGRQGNLLADGHVDHVDLVTGVETRLASNLRLSSTHVAVTDRNVWVIDYDSLLRIPRAGGAPTSFPRGFYDPTPAVGFDDSGVYQTEVRAPADADGGTSPSDGGAGGALPRRLVRVTDTAREPLFDLPPDTTVGQLTIRGDVARLFLGCGGFCPTCAGVPVCDAAGVYEASLAAGGGALTKIASFDVPGLGSLRTASVLALDDDRFVVATGYADRTNGSRVLVATRQSGVFAPLYEGALRIVGTARGGDTFYGCLSNSSLDQNDTGKAVVAVDLATSTTKELPIACAPSLGVRGSELFTVDCGAVVHHPLP